MREVILEEIVANHLSALKQWIPATGITMIKSGIQVSLNLPKNWQKEMGPYTGGGLTQVPSGFPGVGGAKTVPVPQHPLTETPGLKQRET